MTRRLLSGVFVGALFAAGAGSVAAQAPATAGYRPGVAGCDLKNCAYWLSATGTPDNNIVKSGVYNGARGLQGGLCWRTGYWSPAMAVPACEGDIVAKPQPAPAPAPVPGAPPKPAAPAAPAPAPAPKPAPAAAVQKITLASKALFDFDKAVLRPDGRAAIDNDVISKLSGVAKLELVLVTGHTDRIGSQQYNQRLSERRADAVRDYLVSRGVPKDRIETLGMGKTQPVPGVVCNQKNRKELIACLAPNRRVEIEVKGEGVRR